MEDGVRMDVNKATFWVTTGMVSLAMAASCDAYLTGRMAGPLSHLGFDRNVAVLLGVYKGLAAMALLIPAPPMLQFVKEWCYAGLFFVFTGAVYFHLMAGDGASSTIAPIVFAGLTAVSWWLRPGGFVDVSRKTWNNK